MDPLDEAVARHLSRIRRNWARGARKTSRRFAYKRYRRRGAVARPPRRVRLGQVWCDYEGAVAEVVLVSLATQTAGLRWGDGEWDVVGFEELMGYVYVGDL